MLYSVKIKYIKQQILMSIRFHHLFLRHEYVMQVTSTFAEKILIISVYKFMNAYF